MKINYTINGKFLTQKLTGPQRCAREIVHELDDLIQPDSIEIIVPPNTITIPYYKNISVVRWGIGHGILWEQIWYPLYLLIKHREGINFCVAPILKPDIAYVHDVLFQKNPTYCSKLYYVYISLLTKNIISRAKKIITVSIFSHDEIIEYYNISRKKIHVIGNAWQHMLRINEDTKIFTTHPELKKGNYILALGSLAPYKNHKWILENAKHNPKQQYVIAGGHFKSVHGHTVSFESIPNILYLGYVSDSEAKALMTHAKAFLFPSLYEGFGIPPLEALSCGTKIIVSDIPCMREIYGDGAYYINPSDPSINIDNLLTESVANPKDILRKYDWRASAEKLYALLE